ncbi:MAG: YceI family protein [Bacteroidota bacterium]
MKKALFTLGVLVTGVLSTSAQSTWKADPTHTKVSFAVSHLVISEVEGQFGEFDISATSKNEDFNGESIEVNIKVNSVDTDNEQRDGHLKSGDFFDAEKHPQIKFKGKSLKKSGKKYKLVGDLTIRDVTKTVEFEADYNGTVKDPWGNTRAGFKIEGTINRFDYGLKYNDLLEAGGAVVGEEVDITVNVELIKQS